MKVQCAWCKKWGPDKAPLSDDSVSHGICPACAKKFSKTNPGEAWHAGKMEEAEASEKAVKKPSLKDFYHGKSVAHFESALAERASKKSRQNPQAFRNIEKSAFKKGEYVGYADGVWRITKYGNEWLAERRDPPYVSFHAVALSDISAKLSRYAAEHDPRPVQSNPLAVFGVANPPRSLSVRVEGVIYNRCIEVKAEKTGAWETGFWKHPFDKSSKVQLLALDNGDILLHSAAGIRLWEKA